MVQSQFDDKFFEGVVTGVDWREENWGGGWRYEVEFEDGEVVSGMKFWELFFGGRVLEDFREDRIIKRSKVARSKIPVLRGGGGKGRRMCICILLIIGLGCVIFPRR